MIYAPLEPRGKKSPVEFPVSFVEPEWVVYVSVVTVFIFVCGSDSQGIHVVSGGP